MKKESSHAYCPGCGHQHPDRSRFPIVPAEPKYCAACLAPPLDPAMHCQRCREPLSEFGDCALCRPRYH